MTKKVAKKTVSKSQERRIKIQKAEPIADIETEKVEPIELETVTSENEPSVESMEREVFSMPEFDGAIVVKVLDSGETDESFHCQMSDGTTKHVPKSLF